MSPRWPGEKASYPPLQQGMGIPPISQFTPGHPSARKLFLVFKHAEKGAGKIFLSEAIQRRNRRHFKEGDSSQNVGPVGVLDSLR